MHLSLKCISEKIHYPERAKHKIHMLFYHWSTLLVKYCQSEKQSKNANAAIQINRD